MAYTYTSTPVLSKIKIGNDYYYLKDADVRAIIDGFNNDIVTGQLGLVTEENKLVYSQNIKSYVDAEVAKVKQFSYEVVSTLPTPSADTMFIIYLVPKGAGKTGYLEYLCIDKGADVSPRYVFEEIGDTDVDLSSYVTNVSYSNGTLSQTKGDGQTTTVHEFGPFVDASQASGTVEGQTISGVKATGDVSGSAAITTTPTAATLTKGAYTPEGSVTINGTSGTVKVLNVDGSVTAGAAATFTEGSFTPNVPTALDLSKFNGGSKAADTFTQGTLPSKAEDTFTAATLSAPTKSTFATEGIVATVGESGTADEETLIFRTATPGTAVTEQGEFNGGSFVEGAFTAGTLPTFIEGAFTPASLAEGFYTPGSAASKASDTFDGGSATQVTLPTFKDATVLTDASATFTGTTAESIIVTDVSYDKVDASATVTASNVELNVGDITVASKSVTVTPDAK